MGLAKSDNKKCVVDYCDQKATGSNKVRMCFRHGDMLQFILWALPRVQVTPAKEKAVWTPDQPLPTALAIQKLTPS